jgi:hypothetical protein
VAVVAHDPVVREVVKIVDAPGGALRIEFPGRLVLRNSPLVTLASGLIRFDVLEDAPGHALRIEGVADLAPGPTDVQLAPGDYVLACVIPGHAAAGERVLIHVGP